MDSDIVVKKAEKLKAEFKKLRDRKNVHKYEKQVNPVVLRLLRHGVGAELVTLASIFFALLTTLFLIQKLSLLAGAFMAITGITCFLDGIVARETNALSKFERFYHAVSDILIDNIIFFGFVFYFYMDNYFMLIVALLMIILINLNQHMLLLSRFFKLKKIEAVFYRPEFFGLTAVGLCIGVLGLFLTLSFMLTIITTWKLGCQIHQQLSPIFAVKKLPKISKRKSKE
jgi:phosphatidylglycerophosphate synthase